MVYLEAAQQAELDQLASEVRKLTARFKQSQTGLQTAIEKER